jgi:hypothetical protein
VERFCLFVGYSRSGHSLVGAFLNAHRHAVVSHELDVGRLVLAGISRDALYARILGAHPDLLERVRALVGVPLRLIHVVRNPFDNAAAISLRHHMSLAEAIDYYFAHVATTARLEDLCRPEELLTIHHEDLVRSPAIEISRMCEFVGLDAEPSHLADCARIVFPRPTGTRRKLAWTAATVREVEQRAAAVPFLARYGFADGDGSAS